MTNWTGPELLRRVIPATQEQGFTTLPQHFVIRVQIRRDLPDRRHVGVEQRSRVNRPPEKQPERGEILETR